MSFEGSVEKMAASTRDSSAHISITIANAGTLIAIGVLLTIGLYNTLAGFTASNPPFTVDAATLTQNGTGGIHLSIQVTNRGNQAINLSGAFENAFLPPVDFEPADVNSQATSTGTSSSVWQVAKFDGSSTFVRTNDSVTLNPRNLSVEVIFSYSAYSPDQQMIIGKGQSGGNSFYFYSFRSAGNVNDFVVYENNTRYDQQLGDIFVPGNWYDVVFTLDGGNVTAYVNGSIRGSWSHNISFLGNQADLFVGSCSCGGYYFNGTIASTRLYDRVLTPLEVNNNYLQTTPSTNGLSLWYNFNQTSSPTAQDLSGNQNNGVISGYISFVPPLAKGQYYMVTVTSLSDNGQKYSIDLAVPLV